MNASSMAGILAGAVVVVVALGKAVWLMVANAIIKWPRREFKKKIKYSSGIIHQQRQKKKKNQDWGRSMMNGREREKERKAESKNRGGWIRRKDGSAVLQCPIFALGRSLTGIVQLKGFQPLAFDNNVLFISSFSDGHSNPGYKPQRIVLHLPLQPLIKTAWEHLENSQIVHLISYAA